MASNQHRPAEQRATEPRPAHEADPVAPAGETMPDHMARVRQDQPSNEPAHQSHRPGAVKSPNSVTRPSHAHQR